MKQAYKIAFTGVFDLENYGDQLFPLVFEKEMAKRGISTDLYLFAVNECKQNMGEQRCAYAITELERMHQIESFDAIVVGGGEIIHYYSYEHKDNNDEYKKYAIYDLWMIPSIVANKYNVKLFWNAPGVPYDFEGIYKILMKGLVKPIDYLAVRTESSVQAMEMVTDQEIHLCPDSGFLVNELCKEKDLDLRRHTLLGSNEKYIVFHASKLMPKSDYQSVAESLREIQEKGYKVVLLPMAYTNGDDIFLNKFNQLNNKLFFEFPNRLTVIDMISILSGCELYIGFSFHGAITAYSYGKEVISYNYTLNRKTKDLFYLMQKQNQYAETCGELKEKIMAFNEMSSDAGEYNNIAERIKIHFDNLAAVLKEESKKDKNSSMINWTEATSTLSDQVLGYKKQISDLSMEIAKDQVQKEKQGKYAIALEKDIQVLNQAIKEQLKGLDTQQQYITTLENNIEDQQSYVQSLSETVQEQAKGLDAQQSYIGALEEGTKDQQSYIEALEEGTKNQQSYIEELENNVVSQKMCIKLHEERHEKLVNDSIKLEKVLHFNENKVEEQKVLISKQQEKIFEQAQIINSIKTSFVGRLVFKKLF